MMQRSKALFDFENAAVDHPGPDGTPITAAYIDRRGITTLEARPARGIRAVTVPLSYFFRRPLVRCAPPPGEPGASKRRPTKVARMLAQAKHARRSKLIKRSPTSTLPTPQCV